MLMIDSNIIIDFWRNPTKELEQEFITHECCICGVQIAELLYGAASEKDAIAIESALSVFEFVPFKDTDWNILGNFLYSLRKKGITVPFPDAIIACLSLNRGISIWTNDKHFTLIQTAFPALQLYHAG